MCLILFLFGNTGLSEHVLQCTKVSQDAWRRHTTEGRRSTVNEELRDAVWWISTFIFSAQRDLFVNVSYFEKLMIQFGSESHSAHSASSPLEGGWCVFHACDSCWGCPPVSTPLSASHICVFQFPLWGLSISLGGIWLVSVIKSGFYFKPCCGSLSSPRVGSQKRNLETQIQ